MTVQHIATFAELRERHPDPNDLFEAVQRARDARQEELRHLHEAAGDADLNASQARAWEAHENELNQLNAFEHEYQASRATRVDAFRARLGNVAFNNGISPYADMPVSTMDRSQARSAAHWILEGRSAEHLDTVQTDRVDALLRAKGTNTDGDWVARALLLTENDAYRSAFQRVLVDPHPVLTSEEARALRAFQEFRAMSIGVPTTGGYGVPVLIDPTIVLAGQGSLNPFLPISRVETITTDGWKGVSSTGVSWSFDDEATAVSDDTPALAQPQVDIKTARGFVPFSIEVQMDYPNFAQEVTGLLAEGYMELTSQHFAVGNISSTNRGIVTALDANTNVEVAVTTDGAFGAVDVNKAWAALPDRAKGNATWVMSHDVATEVAGFGNGNNLSFVTVDLTGVVTTLRQRPVVFSSYTGDFTGTTGASNLLVVGNFKRFLIAQRAGMVVETVPHLFDVTNNRPTGQRGLYAYARVGSNSIDDKSFVLLQNQ